MQSELSTPDSQVMFSSARPNVAENIMFPCCFYAKVWRVASRGWFRAYHVMVSGKIYEPYLEEVNHDSVNQKMITANTRSE